jgi:chromosome segregation protein
MRLKNLELQGYKTFASRTQFAFDGGITAIVGPNGSGKSNITDAIRWVLGEQSYRALRGKRTEDMIFSGSNQRARLGMASASLVLNNADSWLPIEFAEVTITRRAYRSGENEYLLNGSRVRLRDISELLARSGLAQRTYTVIGQGLVDAVLSLRAEDRRALFEEASGITLYQMKRADAMSRLEETRSNLVRVSDIVHEIAPRLQRLEREAQRASHHALLNQQLEGLLRVWYGYRWREEQLNLLRSNDALARRRASLDCCRGALDALDEEISALRDRQAQLRERLGGWHRESGNLHRQMEAVQRDLAVWHERARLFTRQSDELVAELAELEAQAQSTAERLVAAEQDAADSAKIVGEQEARVAEAQSNLDALERQRSELSQRMAKAQSHLLDLSTRMADRRNRLTQLDERRAALADQRASACDAIAEQESGIDRLRSQLTILRAEESRLGEERKTLAAQAAQLDAVSVEVQNQQSQLRTRMADAQRAYERLQSRYDLLSRLREEGEGLQFGVRAVLQAINRAGAVPDASLSGIVGTVAQLLQVPQGFEIALEVALGGHLQDIVVESWSDAEAAIAFLRDSKRGRATFFPLSLMRPVRRLEAPRQQGIVGVAADLVHVEERLAPVVEMLLGRTLVVEDLKAARRAFDRLRGGFQIVTLGGEILRSSGSVTGGQSRGQGQGQVLAREREWRELPAQLKAARRDWQELEASLSEAQAAEAKVRGQSAALQRSQKEKQEAEAAAQSQRRDLEREWELSSQRVSWLKGQVNQLDEQTAGLTATALSLQQDLARLKAEIEVAEGQVVALQTRLDEMRGEELYQRLSEARTSAAVARGTWEHLRGTLDGLRERQAQFTSQTEAKHRRVRELEEEQQSLGEQIAGLASRETVIQGWLASLTQKIEPAEIDVAQLDAEREKLEQEEVNLRTRLRHAEGQHAQALLSQNRQQDRLDRLRRQIVDDFGLVEMESTEGVPDQPPLPLGDMVSALPSVETLPEGLEEEIHQLRAQLRRMGTVNADAPEEYAEVLQRHDFLVSQAADLEDAASSLQQVIAELDAVVKRDFVAMFKAVASRFEAKFTQLFGGGTAHLILTDPDDPTSTGIEIVARPPGKRQQTLALLSGGERALTAVALIFAVLEVNPPPFCILDEVDAMLDEVNVQRFREALLALSPRTQFIVITHNRGTIQAANTIYGVSMGDDSVSKVVSLRLEGDRIAAPDGTMVEVKDG